MKTKNAIVEENPVKSYLKRVGLSANGLAIIARVDVSVVYNATSDKVRQLSPALMSGISAWSGRKIADEIQKKYLHRREELRRILMSQGGTQ
jgi:hypothetical protein